MEIFNYENGLQMIKISRTKLINSKLITNAFQLLRMIYSSFRWRSEMFSRKMNRNIAKFKIIRIKIMINLYFILVISSKLPTNVELNEFFDLLGLISPIVLQPKLLFRKLCVSKYDWDSILPIEYINRWYKFIDDLNSLKKYFCRPICTM